jgi:hypothetical protein
VSPLFFFFLLVPELTEPPTSEGPAEDAVAPSVVEPAATPLPPSATADVVAPSSESDEGDDETVQIISDDVASWSASPDPSAATSAPTVSERFEIGGWARQTGELFKFHDLQPGRNDGVLRSQLLVRARYSRGRSFEAAVSGLIGHGLFHGEEWRGAFEPQLREAYLGVFWKRVDLRVGQQRVAWGRGEFIGPNDILNSRDTRDPFIQENELRYAPTPMARLDVDFGHFIVQGIFAPWYVPDRIDVYGTNWSGVQPSANAVTRAVVGMRAAEIDPSLFDPAQRVSQQTALPKADYTRPSGGVRIMSQLGRVDLSVMYHYGYDGPKVDINPATGGFSATYVRRHHVGLDASVAAGPIVLAFDTSFEDNHVFFTRALTGVTSPVYQAVATLDYQTGDVDKVLLVEGLYQHIFDMPQQELLAWKKDSAGASWLFRWPIYGPLRVETRVLVGIRPVSVIARGELGLKFGNLYGALGTLVVDGEGPSFGWYYRQNKELYALLKYTF